MADVMLVKQIRLSKSCLSSTEKRAVIGVLDREYLGMGDEVKQFEDQLTLHFGRPAICVSTGTAALHLALQSVGIGQGDEVIVQSLTYVACFQAITATGATAIACDVNPETLCLDWKDAEKRLTTNTKAVMPVHYAGGVGALDDVYTFAHKHGLRIIEDAAHAFGTVYKGKTVGGFGDISCFSFDGIKNITSGEGGCVVTDDPDVLQKVRDARLLGVEKDSQKRYSSERSWEFDVTAQGWRYHMSNIMAAIGIEQLKRFPEFSKKRKVLALKYDELMMDIRGIDGISHDYTYVVPHIYVVKLNSGIDRAELRDRLDDMGIQTGIHYQPNHSLSRYRDNGIRLGHVDLIYPSLLTLPLHPDMVENDVVFICETIKNILHEF